MKNEKRQAKRMNTNETIKVLKTIEPVQAGSERQTFEQLDNLISRIPISTCIMWSYSYCQYAVLFKLQLFNSSLIMSN